MNECYALVKWYCHRQPKYLENNPSQLPLRHEFHISWRYTTVSILCALLGVLVVFEFDSIWTDILNKDIKMHSLRYDGNSNCDPRHCTLLRHKHSDIKTWNSVQITISFSKLVLADSVFHFMPGFQRFPRQQNSILKIHNPRMQYILSYDKSRNIPFKYSSVFTHPSCVTSYTYHYWCC